eukprot:TRINITY_DN20059_c0_g1_i1.p1 TRINITY_DN20059_c0_g1~~TRINITY_DN20059_c0_g1_i1.p1  ORF type:complete len:649 (+),score=100.37 TRINITY_DN20059_c0_g1_i1:160-2106(+)
MDDRSVVASLLKTIKILVEREHATNAQLFEIEEQLLLHSYMEMNNSLKSEQRYVCIEDGLLQKALSSLSKSASCTTTIKQIAEVMDSPNSNGPADSIPIPSQLLSDLILLLVDECNNSSCSPQTQTLLDELSSAYNDWRAGDQPSHVCLTMDSLLLTMRLIKKSHRCSTDCVSEELRKRLRDNELSNTITVPSDIIDQLRVLFPDSVLQGDFKNGICELQRAAALNLLDGIPLIKEQVTDSLLSAISTNSDTVSLPSATIRQLHALLGPLPELSHLNPVGVSSCMIQNAIAAQLLTLLNDTSTVQSEPPSAVSDQLQSIINTHNNSNNNIGNGNGNDVANSVTKPAILQQLSHYQEHDRQIANAAAFSACENLPTDIKEQLPLPCVKGRKIHFNSGTQTILSNPYQPEGLIRNPRRRWRAAISCVIACQRLLQHGKDRTSCMRLAISRLRYRSCIENCNEAKVAEMEKKNKRLSKVIAKLRSKLTAVGQPENDKQKTEAVVCKPHPPPPLFSTAGQNKRDDGEYGQERGRRRKVSKKQRPMLHTHLPSPLIASLVAVPQVSKSKNAIPPPTNTHTYTSSLPVVSDAAKHAKAFTIPVQRPRAAISHSEYLPMLQECMYACSEVAVTSPFHRPPTTYSEVYDVLSMPRR